MIRGASIRSVFTSSFVYLLLLLTFSATVAVDNTEVEFEEAVIERKFISSQSAAAFAIVAVPSTTESDCFILGSL